MKHIPLTRGLFAIVDDDDFIGLSQFKWYAQNCSGRFYAARRSNGKLILMHHAIIQCDGPIDHKDGNGLNNTRSNLRACTHSQNHINAGKRNQATSSQYKGVSYYKSRGSWEAYIEVNGRRRKLGYFPSEQKAAAAYNFAAMHHYGDFARLNEAA